MFRSILVPLDGSAFGEQALPPALDIARRSGARIELVHVHVVPAPMYAARVANWNYEGTYDPRGAEKARAYLEETAGRLRKTADVPVTFVLLEGGVADALAEQVRSAKADLVVMTTHGRGPFSRLWLGSVADAFIRRSTVPVLLLRPREGTPAGAVGPNPRHVLIPLDGSPLAEQILVPAVALAQPTGADYTLLRVIPPVVAAVFEPAGVAAPVLVDEPSLQERKSQAQAYLQDVAHRFRAPGLDVRTQVVVDPVVPEAIFQAAQDNDIDLIALATHGRAGLPRLLLGSVADKVIRGASVPVLVFRPAEK
jgi:nucleotide-binding universal stress UspA family protein